MEITFLKVFILSIKFLFVKLPLKSYHIHICMVYMYNSNIMHVFHLHVVVFFSTGFK